MRLQGLLAVAAFWQFFPLVISNVRSVYEGVLRLLPSSKQQVLLHSPDGLKTATYQLQTKQTRQESGFDFQSRRNECVKKTFPAGVKPMQNTPIY